ncbi:MAG: DinB family protein [Phycisphaeraceae bacterium]|nr:MAG: DinB family protein [Phycisphaeraceae bacterium]
MSACVPGYLDLLDEQRESLFAELGDMPDAVLWYRPGPKVWSIGEHLDHTRVINVCTRRIMMAWVPLAWPFSRPFRRRAFEAEIDDVYKRPRFPMNVGWIWPPKYKPSRPVGVGFLHDALRGEHDAFRRFYGRHDERLLGHVVLPDPVIGALNLVQWLRVQGYHDAHHFGRVRARLVDPAYAERAMGAAEGAGRG